MSAAVESPETPAAMTPIGDVFANAMAKLQGHPEPKPEIISDTPTESPEPVAAATEKAPAPAKGTVKPKSAMDAALGEPEAVEKPAEVVDDDPLKAYPEDAKTKDFKGLRNVASKAIAELKELRAKVGKTEAAPAILSELSTLKQTLAESKAALAEREAKLAEYNDAMTAINLELHPDFRREFIDGRNELVQSAASKLKSYGGNPEALIEALAMPEGKRRDAAIEDALGDDLGETAKAKILRSISEVEALDERKAKAMKAPQQSYEDLERRTLAQKQKAHEAAEQVKTAEFERIVKDLHKSTPLLSQVDETLEGGKEWNASIRQAREDAFKLFSTEATFDEQVVTSVKGKDYDRVASMLVSTRKELAAARAQLAQFDGAQPDIKGNKAPAKSGIEATLEKTPGELYRETMTKLSGQDD